MMSRLSGSATRALFIGATTVAGLSALTPYTARLGTSRPSACATLGASFERQWHGTGEWRRLAPYPVYREASPTDSVGVWLERWHLANGTIELRRVSAAETDVVRLDGANCSPRVTAHKRTFDNAALVNAFTDARLSSLLKTNSRGLIYVWSPRMPLSVQGLAEAEAAARTLGIAFTAVVAEAEPAELNQLGISPQYRQPLESVELVYRNATIHYPAVLYYQNGAVIDGVIPGYKGRDTYAKFGRERLAGTHFIAPLAVTDTPAYWVDRKARAVTVSSVNTLRRIGFFFKPIAGTTLISYTANQLAYFFDISTGNEYRIPGHVDPVPTPDGRFLTLPGLLLHPITALTAGDTTPVFLDPELPDEYQTASILHESRTSTRYRIVTGWRDGARFRDYDVTWAKGGKDPSKSQSIAPVDAPFAPCRGRYLSLPISAKSGREFGAYDAKSRTNFIIEVTDDQKCKDKFDLGFASGKISFSYDGASIAFATSRIDVDAEGSLLRPSESFYKDALVLYRKNNRLVSLSQNKGIRGMTFPEFQKNGTIMLLDQFGPGRPVEVIRVVEVK